jgi:hypothetical protein
MELKCGVLLTAEWAGALLAWQIEFDGEQAAC